MVYNMTGVQESENLIQLFSATSELTGNWLPIMFVLVVYFVMFILLIRTKNPPQEAGVGAGIVSLLLTLMFMAMGLIDIRYGIGIGATLGMGIIALYYSR